MLQLEHFVLETEAFLVTLLEIVVKAFTIVLALFIPTRIELIFTIIFDVLMTLFFVCDTSSFILGSTCIDESIEFLLQSILVIGMLQDFLGLINEADESIRKNWIFIFQESKVDLFQNLSSQTFFSTLSAGDDIDLFYERPPLRARQATATAGALAFTVNSNPRWKIKIFNQVGTETSKRPESFDASGRSSFFNLSFSYLRLRYYVDLPNNGLCPAIIFVVKIFIAVALAVFTLSVAVTIFSCIAHFFAFVILTLFSILVTILFDDVASGRVGVVTINVAEESLRSTKDMKRFSMFCLLITFEETTELTLGALEYDVVMTL